MINTKTFPAINNSEFKYNIHRTDINETRSLSMQTSELLFFDQHPISISYFHMTDQFNIFKRLKFNEYIINVFLTTPGRKDFNECIKFIHMQMLLYLNQLALRFSLSLAYITERNSHQSVVEAAFKTGICIRAAASNAFNARLSPPWH